MVGKANVFMEYLANKNGTGIAGRADESGSHYLVRSVIDDYATNGEVVPSALQGQLKELNDIVRQEGLLAGAGVAGRTALAGAGYSATGNMARVAELEQSILTQSAAARTAKGRAELQTAQANAQITQLQARMDAETFDARREATVAENYLVASTNRQAAQTVERGNLVKGILSHMDAAGISSDDYAAAYMSNDPTMLRNYFGTTDRVAIADAMSARKLADDTVMQGRVDALTRAQTGQVDTIVNDQGIKTEDLSAMLSGKLAVPEGLSVKTIGMALEERQRLETAAFDYMKASTDQAVTADDLQTKLLATMTDGQLAVPLLQQLGLKDDEIMSAMQNGGLEKLVTDLAENPAVANSTAMVALSGPDGKAVQIPLVKLRDMLYERVSGRYVGTANAILADQAFKQYETEHREVQRQLAVTKAVVPFALNPEAEAIVSGHMSNALQLYKAAAYSGGADPAKRDKLITAAREATTQARDAVAKAAKDGGAPEYVIEDIRQGRFTSDRSWKDAMTKGLFFGEAGMGDSEWGPWVDNKMRQLVEQNGLTADDIEKWASGSSTDLEELGIPAKEISSIFHTIANETMAKAIMDGMAEHVAMDALPPELVTSMRGLIDGSTMRDQKLTSEQTLSRLVAVVRGVDEYMVLRQDQLIASGEMAPDAKRYATGTLQRLIEEKMQSTQPLEAEFLGRGAAGGRSAMALMAYYATSGTGKSAFGADAPAFDNIPNVAVNRYLGQLKGGMAASTYMSMSHVRGAALSDAAQVGLVADEAIDKQVIEMAGINLWAKQMANPTYSTTGIGWLDRVLPSMGEANPFGVDIPQPSAWGKALIADAAGLRAELTRLGRPDLAAKITGEPAMSRTSMPVFGY